jgi:hypothetical protein
VNVVADFHCGWSETEQATQCQQHGQPPPATRSILIRELRRLGLPAGANGKTYFTVWDSAPSHWSIVEAFYRHEVGSELELCQVIVIIDQSSKLLVLRKLPFTKTDIDKPEVTSWSPLDLADAEGDGKVDVILSGDAYEDHWIEVISIENGSAKTIFSGLGYFL